MSNCTRCGSDIDFDAGGNMLCQNCEAAGGIGGGTDVPCQRCGMYLPPHELRMWNSRLYCAYCIMDIQDEELYGKERATQAAGGSPGATAGDESRLPHDYSKTRGTCQRCGKQTDTLYTYHGMQICSECYSEGSTGSSDASSGVFRQIVSRMKGALGMKEKPKVVTLSEPVEVFDLTKRKMVEKQLGEKEPRKNAQGERAPDSSDGNHQAPSPTSEVFDLHGRSLIEKKEGIDAEQPLSEGKTGEKKKNPKAKKFFFSLHPTKPKKK